MPIEPNIVPATELKPCTIITTLIRLYMTSALRDSQVVFSVLLPKRNALSLAKCELCFRYACCGFVAP